MERDTQDNELPLLSSYLFIDDYLLPGPADCAMCRQPLFVGDIRVCKKGKMRHFACYQLRCETRINEEEIIANLTPANSAKLTELLDRHNESLRTISSEELAKCEAKQAPQCPRARHLLEIFTYCSLRECALVLPLVSSIWRAHSLDSELWQGHFARNFPAFPLPKDAYRSAFVHARYLTCYACGVSFAPATLVTALHLVTRQPICALCYRKPDYHPVKIATCCADLGVSSDYLEASGVQVIVKRGRRYVLPYQVKTAVNDYRLRRKQSLCQALNAASNCQASEWLSYLKSLQITSIYSLSDLQNTIKTCENSQIHRFLQHIFLEYSQEYGHLLVPVPARSPHRRLCLSESQQSAKLRRLIDALER